MKKATTRTDQNSKTRVSIVGARGYAGLELAKLLLQHPQVQLAHCFATRAFSLEEELLDPKAQDIHCMIMKEDHVPEHAADVVFLATPAEVSLRLAPQLLSLGKKVIDLSGAFRLKKNDYQKWYHWGQEHSEPEILQSADYGLVPFCGPLKADARLIANPGCFATAASLALVPLLKANLIETETLVIDAKSGITGAGRKSTEALSFSEVDGNCQPYRIGEHRHLPEIQEAAEAFSGRPIDLHFSTHLLPVRRGISLAVYAQAKTSKLKDIETAYANCYQNYSLIQWGANIDQQAKLSQVVGTPMTRISYQLVGQKLYVFSVLDNLMKGAASQAVENLNRILDLNYDHSFNQGRDKQ